MLKFRHRLSDNRTLSTKYFRQWTNIFAHFQFSGNSPVLIEFSKILAKGVHSDMLTSFSTFLYSTMVSSCNRTAGVINELITAMLEIDLSLIQHEIDGEIA